MQWALVDSNNIVVNIISYDSKNEYTPPDGLKLIEIQAWVNIGDNINKPFPPPPVPQPESERKASRDKMAKDDLALVAVYNAEKKNNPSLTFSAYLDFLESAKPTLPVT